MLKKKLKSLVLSDKILKSKSIEIISDSNALNLIGGKLSNCANLATCGTFSGSCLSLESCNIFSPTVKE